MKIFIYVVADVGDSVISPIQMLMAPDLNTAKQKILDDLHIQEIDLWIMEFTKGN